MTSLVALALLFLFIIKLQAEICTMDEFSRGEWVYNPKKVKKDFICCSPASQNVSVEVQSACKLQKVGTIFCGCDMAQKTQLTVNEREKWEWVPYNCEPLEYTPEKLCDLIGNRKISLGGDSLTGQNAEGLRAYLHNTSCVNSFSTRLTQVWHIASQFPVSTTNATGPIYHPVFELVKDRQVDIAIMNFGAWYHNMSMYEQATKAIVADIKLARRKDSTKHIQFLWRTNSVGHENCVDYHKPLPPAAMIHNSSATYYNKFFPGHDPLPYNWHLFALFDEYSKYAFKEIHVPWMDIAGPLALRPDMHVTNNADCLHSCAPGALDHIFNRMLMHYLYHFDSYKHIKGG